MIPFNKPLLLGSELACVAQASASGRMSGNGPFTRQVHRFLEARYGFPRCLLTTSCTAALEMAAILADLQPGDEVIVPSFTFVSTALAFVRQGATVVFADCCADHPNLDAAGLKALITARTRAIVPMHYAGVACDMERISALADKHGLLVIADAAQAIEAGYRRSGQRDARSLGNSGHLACFSFHETKNIHCGEGGLLVINDARMAGRAEIVWEKGTNRAAFLRGDISRYEWVDIGSSFLPSDLAAAFLQGQLGHLEAVHAKRRMLWQLYAEGLKPLAQAGRIALPVVPRYATHNAHLFYIVCESKDERARLIAFLGERGVQAASHYLALHNSPFCWGRHAGPPLPNSRRFADCLVRLPLYYALEPAEAEFIVAQVDAFYRA